MALENAKIILFSGTDCSGKDTTMHELAKITNYEPFFVPRSPICNLVYDLLYNRMTEESFLKNVNLIQSFLSMDAIFILIYAQPEILLQRALARNEKHVKDLETFKKHKDQYDEVFRMVKEKFSQIEGFENRFFEFDSSILKPEELAFHIKNEITIHDRL